MGHLKTTRSSWNIHLCSTIFQHGYVHQPVKFSWLLLPGFKGQDLLLERTGGKEFRNTKMHIRDENYWFIFRPVTSEKSCGGCWLWCPSLKTWSVLFKCTPWRMYLVFSCFFLYQKPIEMIVPLYLLCMCVPDLCSILKQPHDLRVVPTGYCEQCD